MWVIKAQPTSIEIWKIGWRSGQMARWKDNNDFTLAGRFTTIKRVPLGLPAYILTHNCALFESNKNT